MKEDLRVLSAGRIDEMIEECEKDIRRHENLDAVEINWISGKHSVLKKIKEMLLSNPSAQDIWKASRYDDEIEHPTTGQLSWGYKYNTLEDYLEIVKLK